MIKYLKLLKYVESINKKFKCIYCGSETYVLNNIGVCSNCENIIALPTRVLVKKDPETITKINLINKNLIEQNIKPENFENAIKIYDELILDKNNSGYLYTKAILLIKYSNYNSDQINYNRFGFMEENSEFNEKSIQLISESKFLLYKIISTCNSNINNNISSFNEIYLMFLSNIKLKKLKQAKISLNLIKKFNENYIFEYAQLLFNVAIKNFNGALLNIENLLKDNNFSINVLFYYSFILFNKNKYNQSKKILNILQKYINNNNLNNLNEYIAIEQNK